MSQVQQLRRERNINTQEFTLLKVNVPKAHAMLLKWALYEMLCLAVILRVLYFPQTKEERDQLAHRGAALKQTVSELEVCSILVLVTSLR